MCVCACVCVCVCVCAYSVMPIATLYPPRELVVTLREPLVATWREEARNLMWTEFVPVHRAGEVVREAERVGDVGRAAAIQKALEVRTSKGRATCAPGRATSEQDGGDGRGGGR